MRKLLYLTGIILVALSVQAKPGREGKHILIYTKNGNGYVHENIASSVQALQEICRAEKIDTEVSDNPAVFTPENLSRFDAVVFSNSNNEGFDTDAQRQAFQQFIRSGKGFAAIHSANATERQWPWYWALVGGKFVRHPPYQEFDVVVIDPEHPSTAVLPARWTVTDECYYSNQLNPDIRILLAADLKTVQDKDRAVYPGETFGDYFPLCWCHEYEGGRQWYTALGHDPAFYKDETFRRHLRGGILWILGI
ncbi:MAG: ThuA domain-containing protein [Mangrovibacterium sp.]